MADDHEQAKQPEHRAEPSLVGTVIKKRYKIIDKLGQGGMGAVYSAQDQVLDRPVAIKILSWHGSNDAARRFHNEARAAGRLHHANTVSVLDFGQTEGGDLYLIMELLRGQSLHGWLKEHGRMPPDMVIQLFSLVLQGLAHAHEKGIVHRDIKPSNILLSERDDEGKIAPKLLDFGISRLTTEDQKLTQTGAVLGSPHYVSPEQARGQTTDERSDIYSIGCTIFQTLTGKPPFDSDQAMGITLKHISEPPPPLQEEIASFEFAEELEEIVHKCMEKDPALRYQSANELRTVLKDLQAESLSDAGQNDRSDSAEALKFVSSDTGIYKPLEQNRAPHSVSRWLIVAGVTLGLGLTVAAVIKNVNLQELPAETNTAPSTAGREDLEFKYSKISMHHEEFENFEELKNMPNNLSFVALKPGIFNPAALEELARHNPRGVDLSDCQPDDECLQLLAEMPSLRKFRMVKTDAVTTKLLKKIQMIPHLEELQIQSTPVDDTGLKAISEIKTLRNLDLTDCRRFTDTGLKHLASLPLLETLKLDRTLITDTGLESFAHSRAKFESTGRVRGLMLIYLTSCKVGEKSIKALAGLKELRSLNLDNTRLDDKVASRIGNIRSLTRLGLNRNPITSQAIAAIADSRSQLKTLDLSRTAVDIRGIEALNKITSLMVLDINDLHLGDPVLEVLNGKNLLAVNLSGNELRVGDVVQWIQKRPNLQIVVFDDSKMAELDTTAIKLDLKPSIFSHDLKKYRAIEPKMDLKDGIREVP